MLAPIPRRPSSTAGGSGSFLDDFEPVDVDRGGNEDLRVRAGEEEIYGPRDRVGSIGSANAMNPSTNSSLFQEQLQEDHDFQLSEAAVDADHPDFQNK
ncbi:unnamed protein product, partial [Amoebophrya sp. A120]|eukprot:GSA120T00013782001.1